MGNIFYFNASSTVFWTAFQKQRKIRHFMSPCCKSSQIQKWIVYDKRMSWIQLDYGKRRTPCSSFCNQKIRSQITEIVVFFCILNCIAVLCQEPKICPAPNANATNTTEIINLVRAVVIVFAFPLRIFHSSGVLHSAGKLAIARAVKCHNILCRIIVKCALVPAGWPTQQ